MREGGLGLLPPPPREATFARRGVWATASPSRGGLGNTLLSENNLYLATYANGKFITSHTYWSFLK